MKSQTRSNHVVRLMAFWNWKVDGLRAWLIAGMMVGEVEYWLWGHNMGWLGRLGKDWDTLAGHERLEG